VPNVPVDYSDILAIRPVVERFVFSSFCHGIGCPDWVLSDLILEGAKVLIAVSDNWADRNVPDKKVKLSGFIVLARGRIAWLYVKDVQLPMDDGTTWRMRGRGLGKALLALVGFTKPGPIPMLFDVPAARSAAKRFSRSGWVITFPATKEETAA
jgi:hypothetical protein